ncbi:MAG: FeoB-associated Cys-rich membrane protein [Firmicutes bacterium]|nr:FeoB-associated Cys-rich membrane protein [Bacillota bacterium]
MNLTDILILSAIAFLVFRGLKTMIKGRKSCCGDCSKCGGCL